jgi:hypothetical protein
MESVFSRELPFHFLQQYKLFVNEIVIVDDAFASGAHKMMVMTPFRQSFGQLVAVPPVSEMQFGCDLHVFQQIEGTVNGRKADSRADLVYLHVNLFCRNVLPCAGEYVHNDLSGFGNAEPVCSHLSVPCRGAGGAHRGLY